MMLKKLNDPQFNIVIIIIVEIISCTLTFTADYTGVGMISVLIKWVPAFIGISTLILYFVSRIFTSKYNWVISLIGIILMITAAINIKHSGFAMFYF